MADSAAPTSASDTQTTNAAAAAAATSTPAPVVFGGEAGEILRQADLLKQENAGLQRELAAFRAAKEEEAKQYAASQQGKLDEYIKSLEERQGAITPEERNVLRAAFTNPQYKRDAERMWKEHQHTVSVTASAKAFEKQLAEMKAANEQLMATQTKLSQSLATGPASMRASYATSVSLDHNDAPQMKMAGVAASAESANALGQIMGPMPSASEKQFGFLSEYGFAAEPGVKASSTGGLLRPMRTSVPEAPTHDMLFDQKTNEPNFPASMRHHAPHIFGYLTNNRSYLDGDSIHSQVYRESAPGTFIQPVTDVNEIK